MTRCDHFPAQASWLVPDWGYGFMACARCREIWAEPFPGRSDQFEFQLC